MAPARSVTIKTTTSAIKKVIELSIDSKVTSLSGSPTEGKRFISQETIAEYPNKEQMFQNLDEDLSAATSFLAGVKVMEGEYRV